MPKELIDLSHAIEDGMVTYPGLPAPVIADHLSRAASRERYRGEAEFHIARIEMVANTGTYIDAPSHRFEGAPDVGELPLASVAFLSGVVVHLPEGQRSLEADAIAALDLRGAALLVHTGWSRHWRTESYGRTDHPYVSREAAELLAQSDVALVGIDSVNIDDMADMSRPAHTILLRANIPVVEHLTNLAALGGRPFTFFAVPAPVRGMGTFPVRAFAALDA
ncbi:MAG TPA: cyclase family protein [Thermoanaerobaculia bacterium]|nr:cyclase family protein [Thermoanaerobaculia bacterium]